MFIHSHPLGQRALPGPMASLENTFPTPLLVEDSGSLCRAGMEVLATTVASGTRSQNANGFSPMDVFISVQFLVHEDFILVLNLDAYFWFSVLPVIAIVWSIRSMYKLNCAFVT